MFRLHKITGLLMLLLLSTITSPILAFHPYTLSSLVEGFSGSYSERATDQHWNQLFDSSQARQAFSISESRFGGFVVTGHTIQSNSGLGDETVWLTRLDSEGNVEWEHLYANGHRGWGQAVIECQNGDLAITGVIDDEFSLVLVIRTDAEGNQLWQQVFNFTQHQEAYAIAELPSGHLVVCGWAWHYRPTNPVDGLLICLDESGTLLWHRECGGLGDERFNSIAYIPSGGLALTGLTESYGNASEQIWVVKTDLQGFVEWNITFGGSAYDRGNSILCNYQGELTIAGITQDIENERLDAFVVHTLYNGTQVWNRTLGLELDEMANAIIPCSEGGYAITGEISQSKQSPWHDLLVIRLSDDGEVLWQKTYGEEGNDIGVSLVECMEGDIVLAGMTSSFGFLSGTAWLARIPNAPPPPIDPRLVNTPVALFGLVLALLVLGLALSVYLVSRRKYYQQIRACT